MPLGVERGYVVLHDGFVAPAAFGSEHVKIVRATVRLPVPFMEAILPELLPALGAEEMLGMPGLLQSRHAFLKGKTTSAPLD